MLGKIKNITSLQVDLVNQHKLVKMNNKYQIKLKIKFKPSQVELSVYSKELLTRHRYSLENNSQVVAGTNYLFTIEIENNQKVK